MNDLLSNLQTDNSVQTTEEKELIDNLFPTVLTPKKKTTNIVLKSIIITILFIILKTNLIFTFLSYGIRSNMLINSVIIGAFFIFTMLALLKIK